MPGDTFEERFLSGRELYGDDFDGDALHQWLTDEKDAYAAMGAGTQSADDYGYHALNVAHGFRRLPNRRFERVLGVGSSFGGEFVPILDRIGDLTILEPSSALVSPTLGHLTPRYVAPSDDGSLPFGDESFDLVVCFGVLHHIATVTTTIGEIARCVAPGGWLLVREPIVSMGDWRSTRKLGVTARERGIPLDIFRRMLAGSGLSVEHERLCLFPATIRLRPLRGGSPFNSRALVRLDALMSRAFAFNYRYHAATRLEKLRPNAAFFVCRKP